MCEFPIGSLFLFADWFILSISLTVFGSLRLSCASCCLFPCSQDGLLCLVVKTPTNYWHWNVQVSFNFDEPWKRDRNNNSIKNKKDLDLPHRLEIEKARTKQQKKKTKLKSKEMHTRVNQKELIRWCNYHHVFCWNSLLLLDLVLIRWHYLFFRIVILVSIKNIHLTSRWKQSQKIRWKLCWVLLPHFLSLTNRKLLIMIQQQPLMAGQKSDFSPNSHQDSFRKDIMTLFLTTMMEFRKLFVGDPKE